MKVHYINILLFVLPLNILINEQRNHKSTTLHTHTNRSLCECDLYMPNYDNDRQMKEVIENFDRQASQRLREYEERIQEKRKQCKEQCDKEIQKIILKDKLEKQMAQQLTTIETKIDTNDIPTCICEKSIADKVEKNCLRCGGILGTAVPELSLLGGISTHVFITAATDAAIEAGMKVVVSELKYFVTKFRGNTVDLTKIVTPSTFDNGPALLESAKELARNSCLIKETGKTSTLCARLQHNSSISSFNLFAEYGSGAYETKMTAETTAISSFNTAMITSIIAIVVIVLILVIIYLILRYRRKKKMKKKLQYIKLLEE
ncbi:rifin [Plasmodium reichenowi]|uniref:Rifin n=1 Tax=Plasmodium reichenowi TaxID=5854 RepID=A0A060RQC9_PLARE|nr:rifin [Plasmodium reichenowi]